MVKAVYHMLQGGVCAREPSDRGRCPHPSWTVVIHATQPPLLYPPRRARWTLPLPRYHRSQQQPDV